MYVFKQNQGYLKNYISVLLTGNVSKANHHWLFSNKLNFYNVNILSNVGGKKREISVTKSLFFKRYKEPTRPQAKSIGLEKRIKWSTLFCWLPLVSCGPRFQTQNLQIYDWTHVCVLSHQVCGNLLQQTQKTNRKCYGSIYFVKLSNS